MVNMDIICGLIILKLAKLRIMDKKKKQMEMMMHILIKIFSFL